MTPFLIVGTANRVPGRLTHAQALSAGLRRHGIAAPVVTLGQALSAPRGIVAVWGWRKGETLRARGHDVLVMERGYIGDRFSWTSMAWNGLNGRAEWPEAPDDGRARFERHHGALLEPWRPGELHTLVIGQVRGDMSLQGRDLGDWYAEAVRDTPGPHRFRPHPEAIKRRHVERLPRGAGVIGGPLSAALANSKLVVTFNSNAGVESVLAGKPTMVADPGSMAWDVRAASPHDRDEPAGRATWAHALSWRQWSVDEIESGAAWEVVGATRREAAEA